ncbi:MAG: hypothetical protein JNJ49_05170, partial [Bdellovibrionaceae bacterium]|nr:hypothetical protein [Pseudobdellovibrionaceae bacterium]
MLFSSLFALIALPTFAAEPISRAVVDLSKSTEIHIAPGRVSVLEMPESIAEAKVGAPRKLKVVPSTSDPKELTLFWVEGSAFRTNLIIRTTKRTFVFDVVPVTSGHQDIIQVRGAFGAPGFHSTGRTLVETSLAPKAEPKLKIVRKLHEGQFE